ncbi:MULTISPECIES: YisL family protein [Bacillus]|uniref:YisL family protein n=1 Tax=Bacillus TaxID=1386 RepID=UPI00040F8085|nr:MULTISPECIES: YisL family protein [Bacillus]
MTHMHITTWVIALILVFVAYGLYSAGNHKGAKITHMVLRLFYILIILTGGQLLFMFKSWNGEYIGKAVLGLLTVGLMEMLLIRKKKEKSITGIWVGFIVILLLTIALGLRLPLGFKVF